MKNMIIGIIPLYKPDKKDFPNIINYIDQLDYCFLLDDTGIDNSSYCQELVDINPQKIEYVCNEKNIGLCASVNRGYYLATSKGADWILIMNPDGTFKNDALSIYREYIKNNDTSKIAIIAPRFNLDRRKRDAKKGTSYIKFPDMSGCLYNTKIASKIGFYDPKTYFYSLDIEYCIRVRKMGYKIIECSEAVLNHYPAETFNVKVLGKTIFKCGRDNPQRYYYQFRTGYYIHQKYHDLYNFSISMYKFLKVIFLFDNKKEYIKMIKLGIKDAKKGFFGNINERRNPQK